MQAREEAPDSIRALYGTDQTANAVHGSDGKESAEREIEFFFPGAFGRSPLIFQSVRKGG